MQYLNYKKHNNQYGFTLIELMVVVAIIAIITMVAMPSYRAYIIKAHRTDGHSTLADIALRQQHYLSDSRSYGTVAQLNLDTTGCGTNAASTEGYYCVTIATTATGYTLTAIPQGSQTDDTECGSLTLDNTGAKGNTGGGSDCW